MGVNHSFLAIDPARFVSAAAFDTPHGQANQLSPQRRSGAGFGWVLIGRRADPASKAADRIRHSAWPRRMAATARMGGQVRHCSARPSTQCGYNRKYEDRYFDGRLAHGASGRSCSRSRVKPQRIDRRGRARIRFDSNKRTRITGQLNQVYASGPSPDERRLVRSKNETSRPGPLVKEIRQGDVCGSTSVRPRVPRLPNGTHVSCKATFNSSRIGDGGL